MRLSADQKLSDGRLNAKNLLQKAYVHPVVSEETGYISFVEKGKIKRDITSAELRVILQDHLIVKEQEKNNKLTGKIASVFKKKK